MNDKELLQLAAKACGSLHYEDGLGLWIVIESDGGRGKWWNPLADDGDALRLAVALDIDVLRNVHETTAVHDCGDIDSNWKSEKDGGDKYAATRRAIVRCAAEIGRQMQ